MRQAEQSILSSLGLAFEDKDKSLDKSLKAKPVANVKSKLPRKYSD
jgi:signal recognition particle GTPase